ncbi:MAG: hypothetical protein L0H23_09355, partial [Luteimonas sp.]|nr:hypothetical protein [Luteimonas sp.]
MRFRHFIPLPAPRPRGVATGANPIGRPGTFSSVPTRRPAMSRIPLSCCAALLAAIACLPTPARALV